MNYPAAIAAKRSELAKLRVERELRAALRVIVFPNVELQPVLTHRAAAKYEKRRFADDFEISAFAHVTEERT